jgi:NAD(P)-dependent dehydrogenase (short-subunit alcohol dehydrogenase family)
MSEAEQTMPDAWTGTRWRLDDRVALVTGASSGLGARFARVLHAAGANVIVTARRADRLEELAQECGSRIETLAGDIVDPRHREAVVELARTHGRLDVLVNNAGTCDDGPLEQQSLDELLCAAPAASVINVASVYGIVASRGPMAAYNATKAALINLTRHLAAVWGHSGVRVNALAPGYFPTELTGFLADPAFAQSIRDRTLLGRTPAIDELDGALLFLATAASSYMTGQALVIDGGWTAV